MLLARNKPADAESKLRRSLASTARRLVQLYEAWGKTDQVAKWQKVLESLPAKSPLEAQGDR